MFDDMDKKERWMTSFTFSAEQVQAAPPEVRRWMENEIVKALSLQAHSLGEPSQLQASTPTVCTIDELVQLLNLISGNFLVTRVFFELARETFITPNSLGLHVLKRNDMQRHVQLGDGHLLIDCLNAINQAFQRIRNDPTASLFAGDESGHIYIHEATYRNIRQLWEKLVLGHSSGTLNHQTEAGGLSPVDLSAREPAMQPEHAFGGNSNP